MSWRRLGSLPTLMAMVLILAAGIAQPLAQPFSGTQSCDKGLVQAALAARRTTGPTAERDVFLRELARLRPDVGGAVVCLQFPTEQLLLRRNPRRDGTDFPIELMQLTIAANETLSLGRYVQWLSQVEVERTHSKGWTISFPGRIDALIRTSLAVDTVREAPGRYQVA
ncbi:MAG TPA: hypothetical protein VEA41_04570, partial [Salinarimonas sp.]|nr:hypothetical protein [Salinarimonas sp.]